MHKLEQQAYEQVRPIFAELARIHLNITAVLDGNCPGQVYVDDAAQPETAYMISSDAYYLAGVAHNHAFNAALNSLLPSDTYFVLFCDPGHWDPGARDPHHGDPDQWKDALEVILKHKYAIRARRRFYTFRQLKIPDWPDCVPEGFSMQRVREPLLAKGLKNTGNVVRGILDEWNALDVFFERGFGFCLVHDDDIVSWSLSDYVSGTHCEIGINTDGNYRKQGFGTLTATATAGYAAAQGFTLIGWHCWDNNVGSIRVAENVGFERAVDYDVHINHWVAENITDMTPNEFRAFAELYEREFKVLAPTSGFPHIVAAKAWALGGERSKCFRQLNEAIGLGWLRSVEQLRRIWPEFFWDPRLDQREERQALVNRLQRLDPM